MLNIIQYTRAAGTHILSSIVIASLAIFSATAVNAQTVFVNELHYDNTGGDAGEAIEIAGPAGTDLAGWTVVLYNGANGLSYGTIALTGVIEDRDGGFGVLSFLRAGIQNGSPDGFALIDSTGVIVQFLSYEGSLTAADGPAIGLTSTDIGVSEPGTTPVGDSLQLTGTGSTAGDFVWAASQPDTFGCVNTGQSFGGTGDPCLPPEGLDLVINEFLADPASNTADPTVGDANRDGARNGSEDEFIELVNTTDMDIDISGWTLADAVAVRHTFPAGTIVTAECAIVVFGGGVPNNTFGGAIVQTATGGFLGLNNSGDTITLRDGSGLTSVTYGGEGGNNQSLTLNPDVTGTSFVQHQGAGGSGGAAFSPGTGTDGSPFSGCTVVPRGPFEIHELQGSGNASPYTGVAVETLNNTVTALRFDGFFIQTPTSRSDNNVDTSDGIFVFTDSAPTVAVGDQVDVAGQVREFFGYTQIGGTPVVTIDSNNNPLPAPVIFDSSVPSPDPTALSCSIEFECYEGMLVQIVNGTVGGSNQRFGSDPIAEVHISASDQRAMREPGVEFPGIAMPPIETWDGNPEVFELDPDRLGLPNRIIPAGSSFDATGVIGFDFGGYEIWPSELTVREAEIPQGVRDRARAELTVGSLNMFRLFDDIDDPSDMTSQGRTRNDVSNISPEEYVRRRTKFVSYILDVLNAPDILAVQEVEKIEVLQDLAADISAADSAVNYTAYLEEGNDIGTIDVGFMVRDSIAVDAVTQINKEEILAFDGSLLNDRPPLLLEARSTGDGADYPIAVMVVHNRSLSGIDGSGGGRVRAKRLAQAQSIAAKTQELQTDNPDVRLVILGDFNAFEFSDGYVDVVGQIAGNFDPAASLLSGPDLVEPDLINQVLSIAPDERYSFVFRGNAQVLDHALTSLALDESVRGLEYGRGNTDAAVDLINDDGTPLRSSDHDGLVLFLTKDKDDDGVNDDADVCPATEIPESISSRLLPLHFALLDGDFEFDTKSFGRWGPSFSFNTEDTGGCSCTQISEFLGIGHGPSRHGCNVGIMLIWSFLVQSDRLEDFRAN